MSWHPADRPNPLTALRRVVEQRGAAATGDPRTVRVMEPAADAPAATGVAVAVVEPADSGSGVGGARGGVTVVESRPGGAVAVAEPAVASRANAGGELPARRSRPWPGSASGRRRPPRLSRRPLASEPEPSHRRPGTSGHGLITSTPGVPAGDPAAGRPLPPITPQAPVIKRRSAPASAAERAMTASAAPPLLHVTHGAPSTAALANDPGLAPLPQPEMTPAIPAAPAVLAAPAIPAPPAIAAHRAGAAIVTTPEPVTVEVTGPPAGSTVEGRRTMTPAGALSALLVCLLAWALVDAPTLDQSAHSSHVGTRRTAALTVLDPLSRASAALGLDRVDHLVNRVLGRHPHAAVTALPPPPAPRRATPTVTPSVAVPPARVPTAADPLRVLVVGDSLGLTFGQSIATKLDATGVVKTTVDAREGTGLARPDSFDWNAQLRADIVRFHPEIVVASFGGNDDQDLIVNGRFITFGSSRWQALYQARVSQIADTVRSANAYFAWSGLPVMKSAAKSARLAAVMRAAHDVLAGDAGAVFVDNATTLTDSSGHYQVALPDASGNQVLVRQPDGVHETPAGGDRLAAKVIAAMTAAWHLRV